MNRKLQKIQKSILEYFVKNKCHEEETSIITKWVQNNVEPPMPSTRNIRRTIDRLDDLGWVRKKKDLISYEVIEYHEKAYEKKIYDDKQKFTHTRSKVVQVNYWDGEFHNFKDHKTLIFSK